ncbi:MAG TPA: biotin/lipoate A/B protein ligase family protein, partial [Candidatus Dormibacteraeota bacterium]
MTWTSLWHGGIRGDLGLAVDEAALGWVAAPGGNDRGVLHLYRFDPPAVVIGYHQDPRTEADLAACAARGVEVHRRLTGGGCILMGPGQLGLALALPRAAVSTAGGFGPVFAALSGGIIRALRRHGVESVLRPKNDLAVGGRKICGVGAYTDAAGMLLFHASTLVDADIDVMLEVLRIPDAKHRDKFVAHAREGMTTLREQTGREVSVEEFAADVEDGYREALGVRVERGELEPERWEDVERLAASRYRDPGWLHLGGSPGS